MKITARLLSGKVCQIEIEGHVFKSITPMKEDILDLPWIAPGLVDIQINGFAGVDFNRAIESDDAWHHAAHQLYAHGCTGFLIALITNTDEGYRRLLKDLTGRINLDPRNCLGFHMEGPWLNPDPGYRGAHRAEWMRTPDVDTLEEWWKMTGPAPQTHHAGAGSRSGGEHGGNPRGPRKEDRLFHRTLCGDGRDPCPGARSGRGRMDASRQRCARDRAQIRQRYAPRAGATGPTRLADSRRRASAAACLSSAGPFARPSPAVAAPAHDRRDGRGRRWPDREIFAGRS